MNFPKNILKIYKIMRYIQSKSPCRRHVSLGTPFATVPSVIRSKEHKTNKSSALLRKYSNITELEEITGLYPHTEDRHALKAEFKKSPLFASPNDLYAMQIEKCVSVEEVFTFLKSHIESLSHKHLAQIVLALYDLKTIFSYHYEHDEIENDMFFKKMLEHQEFYRLTSAIQLQMHKFEPLLLSYTLLYLNKLGLSVDSHLIQNMALQVRDNLLDKFSLNITAQLVRVIFKENSVRPFYIAIDLIPKIFEQVELIGTCKDLDDLTLCLYKMNHILTHDTLMRYVNKVDELIDSKKLTGEDYLVLLPILTLYNLPRFRYKLSASISRCILLMKDSIELLNIQEMCHLYDIFFKNQEPGDVLNTIQRAAAKLLHEIEDTEIEDISRLRLFSSVIYYSSPINKDQFRSEIRKYISENDKRSNLIILRKILSYLKMFDPKLCEIHWNNACKILKGSDSLSNTYLMDNYLYFCDDVRGYKHHAFEHHVLSIIERQYNKRLLTLYPNRFFSSFAFALVCCPNSKFMEKLIQAFNDTASQMQAVDIVKVSHSLQLLKQRRSVVSPKDAERICEILHKQTAKICTNIKMDPTVRGLLVKAAVLRKAYDNELIDDLLVGFKESPHMSSKLMETVCFNLQYTKSLIPEVVNLCTNYILRHKTNVMGFNAEKLLYLLYELNYPPIYEEQFFQTVIDIIIRDQDRMSGLAFLQAALSLCFFNQMPKSFIKQIFNVEFLDRLDVELANCYFRDRYPQRVRSTLMQLNRAVCLEYPEYNIPWFHQKYIEEYQKNHAIDDVADGFHRSVKGYLASKLGKGTILENVIAPYGHEINFVLHLNKNRQPTTDFKDPLTTKYALLLKSENAFTRLYVRLRGRHAMKSRHLEILGYKVKMITENEWANLLYAEERAEYIDQLVFS